MYYELHIHVPGWGFGVTDPTSTKPNPMLSKGPTTSPFLSNPAASPIGLIKYVKPKLFIHYMIWIARSLL